MVVACRCAFVVILGALLSCHGSTSVERTPGPDGILDAGLSGADSATVDAPFSPPAPVADSATVDAPSSPPGPVKGTVLDAYGLPFPLVSVFFDGKKVVTDGNGSFAFDDLPGRYDLVLLGPNAPVTVFVSYQGIQTRTPVLPFGGYYAPPRASASRRSATFDTNATTSRSFTYAIELSGAGVQPVGVQFPSGPRDGPPQPGVFTWLGATTATATLHAVEYSTDPTTHAAAAITGYFTTTLTITDGGSTVFQVAPFQAPTFGSRFVTLQVDPSQADRSIYSASGGARLPAGDLTMWGMPNGTSATVLVFELPGATPLAEVGAVHKGTNASNFATVLDPVDGSVVQFDDPIEIVSPPDRSTGVAPLSTRFEWKSSPNRLHTVLMAGFIAYVDSGDDLHMSSLKAAGCDVPAGGLQSWEVTNSDLAWSVDDLVRGITRTPSRYGNSGSASFTAAP